MPAPVSREDMTKVLYGLIEGLTSRQSAHRHKVTEGVVKGWTRALYAALGVHNAPSAVAAALVQGWLTVEDLRAVLDTEEGR
jgi:DNA-binding NarL/FixJ family response regulator